MRKHDQAEQNRRPECALFHSPAGRGPTGITELRLLLLLCGLMIILAVTGFYLKFDVPESPAASHLPAFPES